MTTLLALLLPLLCYVTIATGQGCINSYAGGKWESYGNCPKRDDMKRIFAEINSAAEKERSIGKVKSESEKCRRKTLKDISLKFPNGTTSNRVASESGGWTVIQRRQDGSVNFERKWVEYVNGFGDPCGEYWLGLQTIYQLTENEDQKLRIDMIEKGTGTHYWAEYSFFKISGSSTNYTLTLKGYSGNATDALIGGYTYHASNGKQFSTIDADNDMDGNGHCAADSGGGWWQGGCSHGRLNGRYNGKGYKGIAWRNANTGIVINMKFVEMKIATNI